ncbi:MAG: DUF29 domain-containing protein [Methylobacter sp.]|nr:DUF29 domain-containing protein [Methylobacter sp.]MDP2428196.1 DUF29 domain-containing protein [Methylobacter sp.]MDP3055220.1 DUF29 domain-containing protein [Methylobacter sp.]MDP3361655.1 DUF29 domain-containing protein [Methylobacter sp.]MDZ4219580.1 DUF29 domain-containing protein [Methylobacter sp.]
MDVIANYNEDFYAWLMSNANLLRQHKFNEVDIEHIAEELEAMGKSEKRELTSRLTVLLAHLLKWQFQPALRSRSWKNTILTQRIDILDLLEDSPSLRYELTERIIIAFEKAKISAEDETGIDRKSFPESCPFSFDQLLNKDFLPED